MQFPRMKSLAFSVLLASSLVATDLLASSHREAPFITQMPKVDATDFYMFRSYESGREDYVTLIANYQPLQDAYGGPNYFALDPNALYEIHIDNNGDAVEDITFQFKISQTLGNSGSGLTVTSLGTDVAVPLKNIGPVSSADSSAVNFFETYTMTQVNGDRRTGTRFGGNAHYAKPLDNIGEKTFSDQTQTYEDYANTFIHDVTLAGCPDGAQDAKVFVGQREDPFAVNLGEVFDLANTNPVGPEDGESNIIAGKSVTSIILEVPIACLTDSGATDTIGGWTSASVRQVQVIDPTPDALGGKLNAGAWTQVSRLGMPLVNEVVIGLPDKNLFNASEPKDDRQFATYVTNPSLPVLLNVLFGVGAPTVEGRPDLVATFLTGLDGVNKNGSTAEMLRLNTTIAPAVLDEQNRLGVAAGDSAGFPNGRRPGDDVVDVALRVVMGALCHLNLGLCEPGQAVNGNLAYTDGALQDPSQFPNASFPYLNTPQPGSPNRGVVQ